MRTVFFVATAPLETMPLTLPSLRRQATGLRPAAATSTPGFHRALPWLLGSLGLTVVSLLGQVPGWALGTFGACILWRYLIERSGRPLPSMLVRVLMFLPLALLVVHTYGTHVDAAGLLTFLIALLALKILELRTPRDFTVAALLGYFMVLSAFFYSQSFALCLYLGLAILANTVALILCHGSGRRGAWPAAKLALGMSLQALPLVALFFIVFPRLPGAVFHRWSGGTTGRMGMSDRLQPGSFSALAQSTERVFRATILSGPPLSQGQLYWRGLTLDLCDQPMSWHAFEQPLLKPPGPPTKSLPGRVVQQITLFPQGERWLLALDRPSAVQATSSLPARLYATETLRSDRPVHNTVIYNVVSELNPTPSPPMDDQSRIFYTHLPPGTSPRAVALAKSWRGEGASDEQVVRAASQFFRTGGFSYTLSPGLLPPKTAFDTFLFKTRQGFCEHYAAAFSTLMRAAGIPARVVVGYQGGEFNRLGGYYRVLQSDAHAWSEVWIDGRGWQREDPTGFVAPERVSYGAENYAALAGDGSLSDQMRLDRFNALNTGGLRWLTHNVSMAWDSMDEQWNLLILSYDQDSQLTIYQKLGVSSLDWLGGVTVTLAIAFTLLGLGTVGMRVLDRGRPAPQDPVRRLYDRFCRRLTARTGLKRAESEGPLDFARRAGAALPEHAAQIHRITDLYVASRYAPPGTSDAGLQVKTLQAALNQFHPARTRV